MGDLITQTDVLPLLGKKKKKKKLHTSTECTCCRNRSEKMKMVTFPTDDQLCQVICLSDWIEESKEARQGTWIRDRLWFERRVSHAEQNIAWILQTQHRQRIQKGLDIVDVK